MSPSTVSRLLNMGVEPFLVCASVNVVLAQRLARRICADCKQEHEYAGEELERTGMTAEQMASGPFLMGTGCKTCANTGYKGRVALYEVMPFGDELKDLVLQGASSAEIKAETKVTIRCIPLPGQGPEPQEGKCIRSGKPSKQRVLMAKAY